MRKVVAAINMTLDGYCDHTAGIPDEELHQHYTELLRHAGVILYGRKTYQLMESSWPPIVKNPTGNKSLDDFAVVMDRIPKIVFSRTLNNVEWENAKLAKNGLEEEVSELRQQPGRDILVGSPGLILALTKLNKCLFGHVVNKEMVLNEYGTIARNEWLNTPNIRKNVELDVFVIMPNHMHGIIILNGRGELRSPNNLITENVITENKMGENVITENVKTDYKMGECNSPLRGPSKNVGAIVRGYKSSVTKQFNLLNIGCTVWQRNYHEHIIRNEKSYQTIAEYIVNNPSKWNEDKFYSQ